MLCYEMKCSKMNLTEFCSFLCLALRESPIKRRSRLSKMITGSEPDKEILPTPITIRNDRIGLHTSPIARRSFDITPLPSNQSDTR